MPCDCQAFSPPKDAPHGRGFASDDEVKDAAETEIREQPKNFSQEGMKKLVKRYKKCIDPHRGGFGEGSRVCEEMIITISSFAYSYQ